MGRMSRPRSALTHDVRPGQIAVARGKQQRNADGWVAAPARHHIGGRRRALAAQADTAAERPRRRPDECHREDAQAPGWSSPGAGHDLAGEVAVLLRAELVPTQIYDFANGEIFVRYQGVGARLHVRHPVASLINEAIMEQLIMVDALRRASAKMDHHVSCPFCMRSRTEAPRTGPISARLVADLASRPPARTG